MHEKWASKANPFQKLWKKTGKAVSSFHHPQVHRNISSFFGKHILVVHGIWWSSTNLASVVSSVSDWRLSLLYITIYISITLETSCLSIEYCYTFKDATSILLWQAYSAFMLIFDECPLFHSCIFSHMLLSTYTSEQLKSWFREFPAQIKCKRLISKGKGQNCSQASV